MKKQKSFQKKSFSRVVVVCDGQILPSADTTHDSTDSFNPQNLFVSQDPRQNITYHIFCSDYDMFLFLPFYHSTAIFIHAIIMSSLAVSRTLFITGASSGIGAATAAAAVASGWNVALMARRADKLEEVVASLETLSANKALAVPGDVTDLSSIEAAVQNAVDKFGGIDAAFVNAGTGISKPGTENGDPAEWKQLVDINIMGVLYTTRAVLPALKKSKGSLVLTGSIAGKVHLKGSIYGASKWFVQGYAGNMAEEMREWGGRCCVVCPGMVNTEFFDEPKPDKLQPEDVAQSVMHAISAPDRASIRELVIMPQN